MIYEGEEQAYLKLAPLLASGSTSRLPWLEDVAREHGDGAEDLWGLVDLPGGTPGDALANLGLAAQTDTPDDYLASLAADLLDGALLEARSGGRSLIAGVEVQEYSFVFDAAALTELPEILEDALRGRLGGREPPSGGFLSAMTEPVPLEYTVYIDEDDFIRRIVITTDLAAPFVALIKDLVRLGEASEDDVDYLHLLEASVSVRLDTIALNDPSLVVELPDPSLVVEVSDPPPDVGGD